MSEEYAVRVRNLSKVFKIYDRPSDRLREAFSPSRRKYCQEYAALRNVNFEIAKGDFLGVVGRNGAGKSTLLKLLSGELTPTAGSIEVQGVVSLLQLGVGFDPELSGIENARFSSKILGYSSTEIERMLKDIIEFADIGEFMHHPVRTYSSGMYSRLSFAVGVNVNPDILIADEVLAVGDMRFSQKCLRKMHEFKASGKTVILVTHDTTSVGVFCNKAIWIKDGMIFEQGPAKAVAEDYKNFMLYDKLPLKRAGGGKSAQPSAPLETPLIPGDESFPIPLDRVRWLEVKDSPQVTDHRARILRVALVNGSTMESCEVFHPGDTVFLCVQGEAIDGLEKPGFGYVLYDRNGLVAIHSNNVICQNPLEPLKPGQTFLAAFRIKLPPLNRGAFVFAVSVNDGEVLCTRVHDILQMEVVNNTAKQDQCGYLLVEQEEFFLLGK